MNLFNQAFVALGTVCWPGDLDIAPATLYDRSVPQGEVDPRIIVDPENGTVS
jgi:hypothetical protein